MNYIAKKIRLNCNENTVRAWSTYLTAHMDEVEQSLRKEGVQHEVWYFANDAEG